ncbi:cytochrome-c peroxidase [Flavobacterium turcicum]|uniref:Cytochrome-c peroxidase n=1 Tax=Flavobacterium turcicum TaxID=2764718 RepID=A0ABR7JCN4_9FLAO|nr:cytochrome c peroxidase [Flavobacterium turcicum]MBC5862260.1 cytochrome-c peroxidase [Flavobacterium turcicum]NHL00991.1 cytochrome-c peroxidase [Flavobacterium turcicum]
MKSLLKILPLFTLLFFSCQKEYETLGPKEELLQQIAQLNQEIEAFEQMAQKNASNKELQQSFEKSRLAYKKIEWAVEYFTPEPARFINGPALDELEVEENKFLNPSGFQVIEELIYPTFSTKAKATLQREIAVLKGLIMQVKEHISAITISPDYVVDAVKMQMYRIITLGITGFDSPIANNSIPEAQASLLALPSVIEKLHQEPSQIQNSLLERISKAAAFCNSAKDFNSFDRALFIKNYLNPISKNLQEFQQHHKIANVAKTNAILQTASSLFGSKVFNVDAFIPSQEYAYTSAKAQLGKELFYDTSFSKEGTRSCASCHNPELAFTDGLKTNLSLSGGQLLRNTPTLTYAGLQNAQFWDMRQTDLEKQSLDVIQNKDEMHGNIRDNIKNITSNPSYQKLIQKAFPKSKKLEEWQLQNALASYVRSLNKFNSKFDQHFTEPATALSAEEQLGFNVFAGKGKCATCHFIPLFNGTVPPAYKKTEQEVIGTPQIKNGKKIDPDLGRYAQYKMPQLLHAFKTPTLRNVALTAPYMHNGVFKSLEEVVVFYNEGGGAGTGIAVDNQTLPSDKLNLTAKEQKALVAFMKTLTDSK